MFSQLVQRFVTNNVVSLFHVQPFYRLWEHLKKILLDYVMWIIITNMMEIMQNVVIMIDLLYHLSYLYKLSTNQITIMLFLLVTLVKMSNQQTLIFHPLKNSIDFFLASFERSKYCIGESISLIVKNQSIQKVNYYLMIPI